MTLNLHNKTNQTKNQNHNQSQNQNHNQSQNQNHNQKILCLAHRRVRQLRQDWGGALITAFEIFAEQQRKPSKLARAFAIDFLIGPLPSGPPIQGIPPSVFQQMLSVSFLLAWAVSHRAAAQHNRDVGDVGYAMCETTAWSCTAGMHSTAEEGELGSCLGPPLLLHFCELPCSWLLYLLVC